MPSKFAFGTKLPDKETLKVPHETELIIRQGVICKEKHSLIPNHLKKHACESYGLSLKRVL